MKYYYIIFIIIIIESCSNISTEKDNFLNKKNDSVYIDTIYNEGGVFKRITKYFNNLKNGEEILILDTQKNNVIFHYFINDTLEDISIYYKKINNNYDVVKAIYYNYGKEVLVSNHIIYDNKYDGVYFGKPYLMNKDTALAEWVLYSGQEIIPKLSNFYYVLNTIDTIKLNQEYKFPINFYNKEIPTKKKLNFYLQDHNKKTIILDTLLDENTNHLEVIVKNGKLGFNRIRGTVEYIYLQNGDTVKKELPFYKNFYVKED